MKAQSKTARCSGLEAGGPLDGLGLVDVAEDGADLVAGVAEALEREGDGVVDDLEHAAADELLVLHQRDVRLDAGGVAVHHEADGAGGGEDRDLGVAVAVFVHGTLDNILKLIA